MSSVLLSSAGYRRRPACLCHSGRGGAGRRWNPIRMVREAGLAVDWLTRPVMRGEYLLPSRPPRTSSLPRTISIRAGTCTRHRPRRPASMNASAEPEIVPLPVAGRADRCRDVVPADRGVSTDLLGR